MDLKVAFPIIRSALLGGEGKGIAAPATSPRLKIRLWMSVARIVCRELGAAWARDRASGELRGSASSWRWRSA